MSIFGDAVKFGTGHMALVGSIALAVGILAGYAFWHHTVYQEGFAACKAEVAEVTEQAKKDREAQQSQIDSLAAQVDPQLSAKIADQNKLIARIVAEAGKPPKVIKGDCTVPADAVAAYNGIK